MDQNNLKNGFLSNGTIDLSQVLSSSSSSTSSSNKNEKKKVARRRWGILARALKSPTGSEPSSPTDEISCRRISSFMLLTTQQLQQIPLNTSDRNVIEQANKRTWYKYSMTVDNIEYSVNVGCRNRTFSAEDLMGFNNTGNICIWPSEETLTYYVGANINIFKDKTVLELGGGMSCLAGLTCAKYGLSKFVMLTDGNKISVENVKISCFCNEFKCPIACEILKWGTSNINCKYDVILCADCLFFDDARTDLIETLWCLLASDGIALIMAPKRGTTLDMFINQSNRKGFACKMIVNYNETVWQKHLNLLNNTDYDDNIHYPILIELTK